MLMTNEKAAEAVLHQLTIFRSVKLIEDSDEVVISILRVAIETLEAKKGIVNAEEIPG